MSPSKWASESLPNPAASLIRTRACHASLLLSIAGLCSCAVGPNYHEPKPDVPADYAAHAAPAAADAQLATWWRTLNDPELDSLVERAIKSNLDLEIALTRLQQARTYEAVVVGHALPEGDASAAYAHGTGSDLARGRAEQSLVSADNTSGLEHLNMVAGFDAVWEVDVFGKYRRAYQAAKFDAQAAAAAREGVITSIVADVVRAYIDLRGYQIDVGVLRQASDALRESLRIEKIRYDRGIINELDVALATREFNAVDSEIAPEEARASAAEYTLAALLGEYPEKIVAELKAPGLIPTVPGAIAPGAPITLLKRRPDIQQAERTLAASTARIGVATANLFPQIALVGALGAQQGQLGTGNTAGSHIWSFGPAAAWPLLDFGSLDGEVDIADLEARANLLAYRKTIISAVQEVDTALDGYSAQRARLDDLGQAMLAGERAVDLATQRYNRGLTDYLNVVDAQRQYYDIQQEYVSAQIAQGEEFVALYKSLGGGWQNYQAVPSIRTPQPAIVAAFRRLIDHPSPTEQ
jgi:NodT family efflux transporter outer membrane factor (OMF) lipoprotein